MTIETQSESGERDIRSLTMDELREEAERLLAAYHGTKDPDEMLDLSTRYTKIDMLIEERDAQSQNAQEVVREPVVSEPVASEPAVSEPEVSDDSVPEDAAAEEQPQSNVLEEFETVPTDAEPSTPVPDSDPNSETGDWISEDSLKSDEELAKEDSSIREPLDDSTLAPAFDLQFGAGLSGNDESGFAASSAEFDSDSGLDVMDVINSDGEAISDGAIDTDDPDIIEQDSPEPGDTVPDADLGAIDDAESSGIPDETDHDEDSAPIGNIERFAGQSETVPDPDLGSIGNTEGFGVQGETGPDAHLPAIETPEGFRESDDEVLESDEPITTDASEALDGESDVPAFDSTQEDSKETDLDDEASSGIEETDTLEAEEDPVNTDNTSDVLEEESESDLVSEESESVTEEDSEVPGSDFDDALASVTAALENPPDLPSSPDGIDESVEHDAEDEDGDESSTESEVLDSNDDLMNELNTIEPKSESEDKLFDIDSTDDQESTDEADTDENVLNIDLGDAPDADDTENSTESDEEEEAAELPEEKPPSTFDGLGDIPLASIVGGDSGSDAEDETTSIGGLDNVPLPEIAQSEEDNAETESEAPNPFDEAIVVETIVDIQTGDNDGPVPAMPSFQERVESEEPKESPAQEAPVSTRDTIPMSVNEELPKFDIGASKRICARCGKPTELIAEVCESCSYSDASLGILNAIVAGDAEQAANLLNAKPSIIHTVTSKHGWTLLHMASSGGNSKLVNLLIRRGSQVNAQNIYGKTALHYASTKGHINIVSLLLNNNADMSTLFEGKSALQHAVENNRNEVAKLLRAKGAQ